MVILLIILNIDRPHSKLICIGPLTLKREIPILEFTRMVNNLLNLSNMKKSRILKYIKNIKLNMRIK